MEPSEIDNFEHASAPPTITLWTQLISNVRTISPKVISNWQQYLEEEKVDVICMMEVFQDSRKTFHEGLAQQISRSANLGASYFQLVSEPTRSGYGNLIISRWPIEQPAYLPFFNFANKEEWGALVATLRTPHGPVCCVISTLAWGFRKQFFQLRQLLNHAYIKHFVKHQIPCLWAGGFRDSLNLQSAGLMYRNQWRSAQPVSGQILTWPALIPLWGPDKIYYNGPVKPINTRKRNFIFSPNLSSHYPLISQFELVDR